jgi:hypothetical protein
VSERLSKELDGVLYNFSKLLYKGLPSSLVNEPFQPAG